MDTEVGKHSAKKELIQGTVEMKLPAGAKTAASEMAVVLLPEESLLDDEKMKDADGAMMSKIVDKMLAGMMHSEAMEAFGLDRMKKVMEGQKTDIAHGFDIPTMEELKSSDRDAESLAAVPITDEFHSTANRRPNGADNLPTTSIGDEKTRDERLNGTPAAGGGISGVASNQDNFDPELQFTTLEVDLGPAILPLEVNKNNLFFYGKFF